MTTQPLLFAHIGDLHINTAREQNYTDFLRIVAQLETECGQQLDFVFLPGDVADHGQPEQYRLVAAALKMLSVPAYLIAGDHDMEQGSLQHFYQVPAAQILPYSFSVKGCRCLLADVNGSGKGGPDFRLGNVQLDWLKQELTEAKMSGETAVLFMHTFPDDLVEATEKAALNQLIADYNVALVDMGHTHYNELANDGQTIFAATRSTGQINEGPVGYSFLSLHNGVVSWRFKPLEDAFPFVMITSPADYRLLRSPQQAITAEVLVQAVVLGSKTIKEVTCRVANGNWMPMTDSGNGNWTATLPIAATTETIAITVQAVDEDGWPGQHTIEAATPQYQPPARVKDGSDKDTIGAWPANGLFGTQLGPNRNAKPKEKPKE